jgi:hypothetical protein
MLQSGGNRRERERAQYPPPQKTHSHPFQKPGYKLEATSNSKYLATFQSISDDNFKLRMFLFIVLKT